MLEGAPVDDILRASLAAFAPNRLAVISAFGPTSLVVLHHLPAIAPRYFTVLNVPPGTVSDSPTASTCLRFRIPSQVPVGK